MRALTLLVSGLAIGTCVLLSAAFFLSPIRPSRWEAPLAASPSSCASAEKLQATVLVSDLPATPDGLDLGPDGLLYASLANGMIVAINTADGTWTIAARAGSSAFLTGLSVGGDGSIVAVDERAGQVFRSTHGGELKPLFASVDGKRLRWTNDVAVGEGFTLVTTTSQTRDLDKFLNEVLEHRGTGMLLRYDHANGATTVIRDDLEMANGVALLVDGQTALIAESSSYRIITQSLASVRPVEREAATNLPGFPGNIRAGEQHSFWVTLLSPRSDLIDALAGYPIVRRMLASLPASVLPKPQAISCVVALDKTGDDWKVTPFALQGNRLPSFSTAVEHNGRLFLSPAGLGNKKLGVIYSADLE